MTNPPCCGDDSEAEVMSGCKKACGLPTVPPANQHRCMGLAPCPLVGSSSAKRTICAVPKVTQTLSQQTWLHVCKRVLCAHTRRCLGTSICLSCSSALGVVILAVWSHAPKPLLGPSDLRNLRLCCNVEILSAFYVGMEDYTWSSCTNSTSGVNVVTLSMCRIYLTIAVGAEGSFGSRICMWIISSCL